MVSGRKWISDKPQSIRYRLQGSSCGIKLPLSTVCSIGRFRYLSQSHLRIVVLWLLGRYFAS